ncbi:MAG: hypothetical protein LBS07_01020 [Prevotellaceae bacterium]|jgi:hypothetical protein|nr:hypothetical protein [Prevotellaceae bacterium]
MKKLHCISLLFLSAIAIATAQTQTKDTVVTRNVTVEREYVPVVKNAGKITSTPQGVDPKEIKIEAKYTDFNLPLSIGSNIHTLPPAQLIQQKKAVKDGFAQIGLGSYPNTLVDFVYPLVKNPDAQLDFTLNHRGTFGNKPYSKSVANLLFNKQFYALDFFAGISGGNDYLRYYGKMFEADATSETGIKEISQPLQNDAQTFWKTGAFLGIKSKDEPYEFQYRLKAGYDLFNVAGQATENIANVAAGLSFPFEDDRIGIDLAFKYLNYDSLKHYNNTILSLNPYYDLLRSDNWSLRLGVKSVFSFAQGNVVNASPDIRFDWKIIPQNIAFYGGLTGDYAINSYSQILNENPYMHPHIRVADTYAPIELFGGFKLKPFGNFLVDIFANFRYIDNQYFFINQENVAGNDTISNRFEALYSTATHFKSGVRMTYNYQNRLNLQFKGAYNGWDVYEQDYAWNKPAWEADFSAGFNVTKELAFSLNAFYEGGRYAKLKNKAILMSPKMDVNIGASYNYLDWLSFFARINNLFNSKYENFYGYEVQGLNVMLGASFSF